MQQAEEGQELGGLESAPAGAFPAEFILRYLLVSRKR
jgi:hypothetical protein